MSTNAEQKYDEIALNLIARYAKETGRFWKEDPMSLCVWILDLSSKWSIATWRLRKTALANYMSRNGPVEAKMFFINASKIKNPDDNLKTKKEPLPKTTKISVSDLYLLIDTLGVQSNGKHDKLIALWILSGLLTGISPSEWHGARIDGSFLVIRKICKGKSGPLSYLKNIEFKQGKPNDQKTIGGFVAKLSDMNLSKTEFDSLLDGCRRRLYVINKKLWPDKNEMISLYLSRHHFSYAANMSFGKFGAALLYQ